jgi:hypothetical protein
VPVLVVLSKSHGFAFRSRLQVESRRQGVSASQYIREAAIARYWLDIARNERPELAQVEEFLDAAKALERDHED